MSEESQQVGLSQRGVEIGVAVATAIFALLVIAGSLQAGIDWGAEGPRAGFFPFYVGLTILGASIINLAQILSAGPNGEQFADWRQLRDVSAVVLPTAVYVVLIPYIGIYLSSAILIALFMKWLGRYSWGQVLAVAIGVPVITFAVFEKWFLVPLPKGPIEELLGF